MRIFSGALLTILFNITVCFAQNNNDTFHLNKLPPDGVLLDKGWKFHAGDDTAWANPGYDDSKWDTINPSLDIRHIPRLQDQNIYWFRLTLDLDSSISNLSLGMLLSQVGASEVYIDGNLIYKFGLVSADKEMEHTHYLLDRPFGVSLGSKRLHTIAVRYSFNPKNFLVSVGYQNSCLRIVLNTVSLTYSKFLKESRISLIRELINMALWLMLSFICFGLYHSFRTQKAYLYIGIYSLLLSCNFMAGGLISREFSQTTLVNSFVFAQIIIQIFSIIFALNGLYLLFNEKKSWVYYFLAVAGLFILISFILFYDPTVNFYLIYLLLNPIEFFRIFIKAMYRKRQGVIILFITRILFFIFMAGSLIAHSYYNSLTAAFLFGSLATGIEPLGWSLFMAGEYGRANTALQSRMREVQQLSKRALAQEQEKQQILSTQNETLEKRVIERTSALNESLQNLRSTQKQLIQSEKMASLGELTAGIAHEIQNPLNFINNFSEVNQELLAEMKDEIDKLNIIDVKNIANDLIENEAKINQHGKRVDAIVKGMLQHSRSSTGQKEPTDVNLLTDEYLRLSYHGAKAKDKDFNAHLETDFDDSVGKIDVIPQEIGRVLLNLYNNAFYAVTEKKKQHSMGYEPTVSVVTKKLRDNIEIRVRDNGNGVPKKVADKIFQPFFTTKPTGEGTGLGLSLSYDIIKAHGGEIKVNTNEGEFTEFMIQLPISV